MLAAACGGNANRNSTNSVVNNSVHSGHDANSTKALEPPKVPDFKIEMSAEPAKIDAGKEIEITFTVKDKSGATVKGFKTVHEKKMHLIVVSDDLVEFDHIHPDLQPGGIFKVKHTFKNGGKYILYADATPENGAQVVERLEIMSTGNERTRKELLPDTELKKTVDGITVALSVGELKSYEPVELKFIVTDEKTGKPATNLQNYLGELAHVVAISEDTKEFLHVHPQSVKKPGETAVAAHTTFPMAGAYKLWAQFQRGGKVIVVPFVVKVAEANKPVAAARPENGIVMIKVNGSGYSPSVIDLKKGEAVKLIFVREDANNCGDEVVFTSLNIKKKLEVGKEVAIEITPTETGEIGFACGMNMYKGKLLVN